ncbi:MAG: isopentenyl-diphosphate Delta-isomerase [Bacteroidetes bacterium]|jgi:isopentenyl-diphosphate delta-isomerase|nr:isopentenyl-diphosphate Delta-isomerase [Bacteroidota bacterium]
MKEYVVLVNERDEPVGIDEKLQAHIDGVLHRAFSVFVFNSRGDLLLQQRHPGKYHSGGLWSNTCCSHPRPGEAVEHAARRRLREEMGFSCDLERLFGFVYKAQLDHDLYEHEYDHVFVGSYDGAPEPNGAEVSGWRWVRPEQVQAAVAEDPSRYTYWFRLALNRVLHAAGEGAYGTAVIRS